MSSDTKTLGLRGAVLCFEAGDGITCGISHHNKRANRVNARRWVWVADNFKKSQKINYQRGGSITTGNAICKTKLV